MATIRSRKPGREALDLVHDGAVRVAGIAVRDVRVGPNRVDVAVRAIGIGEVLLGDEHEGALRHPAAVDLALGCDDLLEGSAAVDGAGAPAGLVGPGHAALDREVDLEGAGPVSVAAVGARHLRGKAIARRSRRWRGGEVEEDDVGRGQLRGLAPTGLDGPAVLAQVGGQRVGDRLRAASATAQPKRWHPQIRAIPTDELIGRSSGLIAWAATPPNSARA